MKGHVGKRGSSWYFVLELERGSNGKRRQKWYSGFRTRKDAERELARAVNERNTGAYVEPTKMTVGQYLEKWLAEYAKPNVAAKTYERYAEIVTNHLTPALGHLLLTRLQPLQIQSYYTRAQESGRRDGKGGLSAQTVLHHHRVLHAALEQAVKWQVLARNPTEAAEPPRPTQTERPVLDRQQTVRALALAEGTILYLPILLAATTGMRRGEIVGLRWEDLDLKTGILLVRQSLGQTRAGVTVKKPKNNKARRIELPSLAVEALVKHRAAQAEHRLQLGPAYHYQGMVIAWEDGRPMQPDNLTQKFALFAKKHQLGIRFNDLRHTHTTHLLAQGESVKMISERLGHSTGRLVTDRYGHLLPGAGEQAAQRLDAALREAMKEDAEGDDRRREETA